MGAFKPVKIPKGSGIRTGPVHAPKIKVSFNRGIKSAQGSSTPTSFKYRYQSNSGKIDTPPNTFLVPSLLAKEPTWAGPLTIPEPSQESNLILSSFGKVVDTIGYGLRYLYNAWAHRPVGPVLMGFLPRRREIPRLLFSSNGNSHPFKLFLYDNHFFRKLRPGKSFIIAKRQGNPIRLRLMERSLVENEFLLPGAATQFDFAIEEGNTEGFLRMFMDQNAIYTKGLVTNRPARGLKGNMAPGVGSIIYSWVASQSLRNQNSMVVLQIVNPDVLAIIKKNHLMDPDHTVVEVGVWLDGPQGPYDVVRTRRIDHPDVLDFAKGIVDGSYDFLIIRGKSNPRLLLPPSN